MREMADGDRFLVCRPRGGFNDTLTQIEKTRRYAIEYGRTLVLDTTRSGLGCRLDRLFHVRDTFGCKVLVWTEELGRAVV